MTTHMFHEFPQDEQDDLTAAAAAEGFDIGEFTIIDEELYPPRRTVGAIRRQVTVTRLINKTIKVYYAGHGTPWTVEFEQDLAAGAFGA
jgi:hypothetical protein